MTTADLVTHHHGSSTISIIKAAPSTAGWGTSSKCRTRSVSARSLCTHSHRSSAQPGTSTTAGKRLKQRLAFNYWNATSKWEMLKNTSLKLPYISLVGIHAAIILPAVPSVPGWAVVRHARHCSSGSHRTIMHGYGSSLISFPAVRVSEFSAWGRRRLSSANRFKVLGVAIKARALSVLSRATLLYFWLTVKAASSRDKTKIKFGLVLHFIQSRYRFHRTNYLLRSYTLMSSLT